MWRYHLPTEIQFGVGEAEKLGEHLQRLGLRRALLVCDPFVSQSGVADTLEAAAGGRVCAVTAEVEPNPTLQNIDHCAAMARECSAQCVIGVGGGSAMDCAKSAAAAASLGCSAADLLEGTAITAALPIVAVPTTAGTGSEVTAGAVVSDKERGIKSALFSPLLFPRLSIVDPALTYTCPAAVTASSGIDVLMHALDALCSVKASPVTDALAVKSARLAFQWLPRCYLDGADERAREAMSMASVIAGLAFSQTGTTGSHACSYILTAKYRMPHGEACAFTADSWFLHNAVARPELDDFACELGFENAAGIAGELNRLKKMMGMRCTLEQAGIREGDLNEIVESCATSGNMANNIAKISRSQIREIFLGKA